MEYSHQPPRRDKDEYHCPHCGVLASFTTFPLFHPALPSSTTSAHTQNPQGNQSASMPSMYMRLTQNVSNEPSTFDGSRCAQCTGVLLWNGDTPYYPAPTLSNETMEPLLFVSDALPDGFIETIRRAVSISAMAPDAAAALLRRALLQFSEALGYTPAEPGSTPDSSYVDYLIGVFNTDEMTGYLVESCRRAGATLLPDVIYEMERERVIQPLLHVIDACARRLMAFIVTNAPTNAPTNTDASPDEDHS